MFTSTYKKDGFRKYKQIAMISIKIKKQKQKQKEEKI